MRPTSHRPTIFRTSLRAIVTIALLTLSAGCTSDQVQDQRDRLRNEGLVVLSNADRQTDFSMPEGLGQGNTTGPGGRPTINAASIGWSIILASFKGEGREEAAATALNEARQVGLSNAYLRRIATTTTLGYGSFDTPSDARATSELARVRAIEVRGVRPFEAAFMAPPPGVTRLGNNPELNLINAKRVFGVDAIYTLQIGVYARDDLQRVQESDLREVRSSAEAAVATLRLEGEMAFYYHGRHRSMVTIGVFGPNDFDPQNPAAQSPELLALRARHPNNLYNGQGIRVTDKATGAVAMQRSMLVGIPER